MNMPCLVTRSSASLDEGMDENEALVAGGVGVQDGHPARIIRYRDLSPTPWRNGGGITREVAVGSYGQADGGIAWRVSVANVKRSGDFSPFPGADRILVLCSGSNMIMDVDGRERVLQPMDMVRFAGDAETSAVLTEGGTVALNVMTRRGIAVADVSIGLVDRPRLIRSPASGAVLLVVVDGQLLCRGRRTVETRLSTFDAVHLVDSSEEVEVLGRAHIARIELDAAT